MALQKQYDQDTGQSEKSAYHRVVASKHNFVDKIVQLRVYVFKDAQARLDNKKVMSSVQYVVQNYVDETTGLPVNNYDSYMKVMENDDPGTNERKQAYLYLKGEVSYYSGAIDV